MYFLILLFSSFLILLPSLNLQIIIYLELEKSITLSLTKTLVNSIVLSRIYHCSLILINLPLYSLSLPQIELLIHQSVQHITYVFEIIPLLPHTNTYLHGSHLTNALLIAYYLLFIPQYTLRIAPPIFLLL